MFVCVMTDDEVMVVAADVEGLRYGESISMPSGFGRGLRMAAEPRISAGSMLKTGSD